MSPKENTSAETLEKIFHEPNRLAIMSTLCAENEGLTFNELREACNLTAGNLNRHLKVLREANAVEVEKEFVDDKPRTTITLSQEGLSRFSDYLAALSKVLADAKKALPKTKPAKAGLPLRRTARA